MNEEVKTDPEKPSEVVARPRISIKPVDVIIWCCVAAFVAVTIMCIFILVFKVIFEQDETYISKLFTLFVLQIIAVGVAVFGKEMGAKIDTKKPAPAEA